MSENEELDKAVASLRKPYLISENRESVVVYRDDLTLVLDRLEELEGRIAALPEKVLDVSSELAVGDEVEALIDYVDVKRGMTGKVARLRPSEEYPIEVQFEGTFFYSTTGVVAFKRYELGKVKA